MPKTNTLFSYFTKTPDSKKNSAAADVASTNNGVLAVQQKVKIAGSPRPGKAKREAPSTRKSSSTDPKRRSPKTQKRAPSESEDDADDSKENYEDDEDIADDDESSGRKSPGNCRRSGRNHKTKRRRIVVASDSDDSGDEYKPDATETSDDDVSSGVEEEESEEEGSDEEKPVKSSRKRKRPAPSKPVCKTPKPAITKSVKERLSGFSTPDTSRSPVTPSSERTVSQTTKSKLANFSSPVASEALPTNEEGAVYTHFTLDFLQPGKIKDMKKHTTDSPEYDPKTLYVPADFIKKQTPAMRQWWEIKSKHYDTVLFFKVGKFYELYHMDAVTGVNELGLIYMKGKNAHSGFPEIAYGRYSNTLIQKGYKVARVEQTELPEEKSERNKGNAKLMSRELCRITSKGTKTYSYLDGDSCESGSDYLLALCEKDLGESSGGASIYGVCFVDTSIGKFHFGQFQDDRHASRMRTLIAHHRPAEVLYERGQVSPKTQLILNNHLTSARKEALNPNTEFWDSTKTLRFLSEGDYFLAEGQDEQTGKFQWPEMLKKVVADSDTLGHTASDDYELAVRALGAITWYLQRCCVDQELLSMKQFLEYVPLDAKPTTTGADFASGKQHMVLDSVTLCNLEILENSMTGTQEGTLLERLDQCVTPFGKRLFRQWLCAPLCNPTAINDRLDAIDDLIGIPDKVAEATDLMKKMPDLERLLSKIHTLGNASRSKNHPDSRAIFYEDITYSKRKIEDFLSVLGGFQVAVKVIRIFEADVKCGNFKSKLLHNILSMKTGLDSKGHFPNITEGLSLFDNAFDHNKAKKEGVIIPTKGVSPDYDAALADIGRAKKDLDSYLDKQKQRLGCKTLVYFGSGKNRYQIEVPESIIKRVPDEYTVASQRKGFKRYTTDESQELFANLMDAEDRKDWALKDCMRCIFHRFDECYPDWSKAVQCLAVLDALMSMSSYSRCGDGEMCRPEFVLPGDNQQPFLEIREARHPCVCRTFSGGDFIPNDTVIGTRDDNDMDDCADENSSIVLVTGPNMGGKSTLMRQAGVIVVMAQLGVYVPAEKCCLTPADRVFTRLGASDRIMAGESTFFVELSETSAILRHATKHSLVLLDELGRGTATYDGTAIACAVVQELSQNICCRTLFSTHYHSLVEEFSHDPNIRLGHMACMVENENDDDPSQETITFLYKFVKGACPKSYGFNAARLADLPDEIIKVARAKANDFEQTMENLKSFRQLYHNTSLTQAELGNLQKQIQVM